MCARVRLTTDYSELRIKFWVDIDRPAPNLKPSYNIAPTQDLTVLRFDPKTKKIFLPAAQVDVTPAADANSRPKRTVREGSFAVLVVGR